MYINRYPITLGLALREMFLSCAGIWRAYRADSKQRARLRRHAQRYQASLRPMPDERPFSELRSLIWMGAIMGAAVVLFIDLAGLWPVVEAWFAQLFGDSMAPAAYKAAAGVAVLLPVGKHRGRMHPDSLRIWEAVDAQPHITGSELAGLFGDDMGADVMRKRIGNLRDCGFLYREGGRADANGHFTAAYVTGRVPGQVEEKRRAEPANGAAAATGPVVPPRQPDNTRPWAERYLVEPGARPGAFDFRQVPSLRGGGQRVIVQAQP